MGIKKSLHPSQCVQPNYGKGSRAASSFYFTNVDGLILLLQCTQECQRPLVGEGVEERRVVVERWHEQKHDGGRDDLELGIEYYDAFCDELKKERLRIGGDWVVADACLSRRRNKNTVR